METRYLVEGVDANGRYASYGKTNLEGCIKLIINHYVYNPRIFVIQDNSEMSIDKLMSSHNNLTLRR